MQPYSILSPYLITTSSFFLRDEPMVVYGDKPLHGNTDTAASVSFHVASGDYFSTLATILGFLKESADEQTEESRNFQKKLISELQDDLLFLQRHYDIISKYKSN